MQSSEQAIRFAGDVSIAKIKIITRNGLAQDITGQVINVQIFEDLFSPFITGSLILKESLDLINLFPFAGEEEVEIEINTPSLQNGNINSKFYIYKMTDREMLGDRNMVYQLHFISNEAIVDLNKKISRVYGDKPEVIIKSLLEDQLNGLQTTKKVIVEPTAKTAKFISNFWSPVEAINYTTQLAENKNGSPSFLFYENRDGFNFTSLETLYDGLVYQEFVMDKYTRDDKKNGGDAKNVSRDYKRIGTISIPKGFDYMERIRSGMLSSKMISYDLTKKAYNVKNFNMFDGFDSQKHLNTFNVSSGKAIFRTNSKITNYPRMNSNFSGFNDATNYRNSQKRASLLLAAEANKIQITVPGRCDYTVGQKVKVTLNKMEPISKDDTDITDKMFSGYYLISAINHYITRDMHECNMELIKDSLLMSVDGK